MKIKMLFMPIGSENKMYLEALDGKYYNFFITPARELTDKDLTPCPGYHAHGNRGKEAKDYFYSMYKLEKAQGNN